ncbi:MAG: acylneuraminate cytidylyltransferase family protein [Pseudomonadota bacterium]
MLNNKKILAVIPARGGSKGVPRKNLRPVDGVSLLARTIHSAKQSHYIDKVIVSSEDNEIIAAARQAGAEVPFVRPAEFASDEAPGYQPIIHALENVPGYDYVIVLQVTSPLRDTADIDGALDFCLRQDGNVCVSVTESAASPYWMYRFNENSELTPILAEKPPLRRQDLPATYVLNGAIYIAATSWFLRSKSFLTSETLGYVMPQHKSLDIDTEFDFQLLNLYLKHTVGESVL